MSAGDGDPAQRAARKRTGVREKMRGATGSWAERKEAQGARSEEGGEGEAGSQWNQGVS